MKGKEQTSFKFSKKHAGALLMLIGGTFLFPPAMSEADRLATINEVDGITRLLYRFIASLSVTGIDVLGVIGILHIIKDEKPKNDNERL